MAEEEPEPAQTVMADPGVALGGTGGSPKAPGWYPSRANPSDQTYWDGQNWTARRRWTAGTGWLVAGDAPEEVVTNDSNPPVPGPRGSGNPYVSAPLSRSKATGFTLNMGVFLLLVCGIALMYGSIGEWVHISGRLGVADFHASFNGVDPAVSTLIGVNGWVTFIGGTLLVIFACFEMTSDELQLSILTTLIAAVTTIFAIFDMVRIAQKLSQVPSTAGANASVGWGLICVLSAAVLATLIAVVSLLQR